MVKGERYFEGDIWVDDRDLQIVKTYGKGVGLTKKGEDNSSRSSRPTASRSTENTGSRLIPGRTIRCTSNMDQRIHMVVKYENYKRFGAETTVTFGDEVPDSKSDNKQGDKPKP